MNDPAGQGLYVTAPSFTCAGTTRSPGCGRDAHYVLMGHKCAVDTSDSPYIFKCGKCYMELEQKMKNKFAGLSSWTCEPCGQSFTSWTDYAQYEKI